MQHHRHSTFFQMPCIRSLTVVDLSNPLYFQKMIPAADRPDLVIISQLVVAADKILQSFCAITLQTAPEHGADQPPFLHFVIIMFPQTSLPAVPMCFQQSLKTVAEQRLPLSSRHRDLPAALKKDMTDLCSQFGEFLPDHIF